MDPSCGYPSPGGARGGGAVGKSQGWGRDQAGRAPLRNLSVCRWRRRGSPPGRAEGGSGWARAMELLKLNRSLPGSGLGLGASFCRPAGPLLNSSGTGNLSCEPPRIRGAGTRGGCLSKPPPQAPSHCTPHLIEELHSLLKRPHHPIRALPQAPNSSLDKFVPLSS